MKKNGVIVVLLMLVVGIGACVLYAATMRSTQQQSQEAQQKTIRKLEKQNERLQQKLQQKQAEATHTSRTRESTVPSEEPQQEKQQKQLENVAKDLYTNLYTYDPQSYTQREDSVKQDLSPELRTRLFQKNPNVGDSHSVTCRADDVAVYAGQTQGDTQNGVVIVTYHVRLGQGDDIKNKDIYQFQFDQKKKIVTDQTLVTSGITEPSNE